MGDSADKKKLYPPGDAPPLATQTPNKAPPGPIRSPLMREAMGANRPVSNLIKPKVSPGPSSDHPAGTHNAALSPTQQPNLKQNQAHLARSEVSAIHGLQDPNQDILATALSHHMFDPIREKRKLSFKFSYFVLPVAITAVLAWKPEWRSKLWPGVQNLTQEVMHKIRPPRKPMIQTSSAATSSVQRRKLVQVPSASVITKGSSCSAITSAVLPSDPSLALKDRITIAECFLALDDAPNAEEILRPLKAKLEITPENILNRQKASGTLADAQQILVMTYLKMAKAREAGAIVRRHCPRWQQTNTCVAKLLIHADRRYDPTNLKPLFETSGRLDRKAQARLWYAGARVALHEKRSKVADQRFGFALKSAPIDALSLRKQIYEAQAIDLYRRGETARLQTRIIAAKTDLKALDRKAKIKLSMFEELTQATDKRRTLKKLLTREDITYRARSDMDLIDILGPESIRYGLETDYLRLLNRTRKLFSERLGAGSAALKRISLWEIRALFAQKQYDATLHALGQHEADFGQNRITRHFMGLLDLQSDSSAESARMAVEHFQEALRIKGSWESRYALGVALIRGKRADTVPALIRDLENALLTPEERFWTDMLKAEWYIAVEKYVNAIKLLQDWIKKAPDYATPRELLVDVLIKMGNKTGAEEQQRTIDDLRRRQPAGKSLDVLVSPLEALAYEERELN